MTKTNIITLLLFLICTEVYSANRYDIKQCQTIKTVIITGRVIDAESKEAIPQASISILNSKYRTTSDSTGYYHLILQADSSIRVKISAVGYLEQEIRRECNQKEIKIDIYLYQNIFSLNEVIVTGTRTDKTLMNVPTLTRIISSAQTQRNDFVNITDALEYNIPGLQFNSDPRGNNIRIQGLENKYILMLVDGERLSNTPGGPIDFDRLSTANIKQIEVIKGAASALYGSSAMGMIVNIITKDPIRQLEGWSKVRYSRFNDLLFDSSIGVTYRSFTSQTLFNRSSQDGYDLTPESPQAFTKDPSINMTIEERLRWSIGKTKISATGSYFQNEVKNPPASVKNTHYKSHNKTIRLAIDQQIGENHQVKAVYYGDFYTRKRVFEKLDSIGTNATSDVQTVRLTDIYTPTKDVQIVFGSEYNWNKDYNEIQYGEQNKIRKVSDINLFTQGDLQITKQLNILCGFRYTYHSAFGNAFTPKISAMYNTGRWKLRAGYSKGFKAPDATELYSDFMMGTVSHNIGNPNLKAERSNYFSVSGEYLFHNINISTELYQNRIQDKIQSSFVNVTDQNGITSTELRYDNVEDARIRGLELNIDYYPIRQLYLRGGYAYTDAIDLNSGLQLSGNTKHAVSFNTTYRFNLFKRELSLSLAGHWSSHKINDEEEIKVDAHSGKKERIVIHSTQPAYSLWKFTTQYTLWKKGYTSITITAGIQNIFNYTDPIHYTTYDPGRRIFSSISLKF